MFKSGTKDCAVENFNVQLRCTCVNWDRNRDVFSSSKRTVVSRYKYQRTLTWSSMPFLYLGIHCSNVLIKRF